MGTAGTAIFLPFQLKSEYCRLVEFVARQRPPVILEIGTELVTPGGYVAFHDILHPPEVRDCEVDRLWVELRQEYPEHFELVEDPRQGWGSLGVLRIPRSTRKT